MSIFIALCAWRFAIGCFSGPIPWSMGYHPCCACYDRDKDGDVDLFDWAAWINAIYHEEP